MLPQGNSIVTGTYYAEKVAEASYDLVCTAHADSLNEKPATQHGGGSSGSTRPVTGAPTRRKDPMARAGKVVCTQLPSLNSIELLLEIAAGGNGKSTTQEEREEYQSRRAKRALRLNKISARLSRGAVPQDDRATPSDMEVLAGLTQPLSHFTKLLPIPRRTRRLHDGLDPNSRTFYDAVASGLAGTGVRVRPRRKKTVGSPGRRSTERSPARTPKKDPHTASMTSLRSINSVRSLEIVDVPVLPESSAEAFLMSESMLLEKRDDDKDSYAATPKRAPADNTPRSSDGFSSFSAKQAATQSTMFSEGQAGDNASQPPVPEGSSGAAEEKHAAIGEVALEEEEEKEQKQQILEGLLSTGKISTQRREASQSLRTFVFGYIKEGIKSGMSAKDVDRVCRDKIGTKVQVGLLHAFWTKLDRDRSGSVDAKEFKTFVEMALKDIQDGQNRVRGGFSMTAFKDGSPEENATFAKQLIDRVGYVLFGKKQTFVIEDMMRIIWPCCRNQELKLMKTWVNELELSSWRRDPPKQLSKDEFEGLAAVFRFFDTDKSGSITVEELVLSGFIDKDQAAKMVLEVDGHDGDGELCMLEFCELFCPTGYRAHENAKIGTDDQGQRLVFDDRMNGWRLEDMDPGKAGLFS